MSDGGWPFGGWVRLESDAGASWPKRPWRSYREGTRPWDEVPLYDPIPLPPDQDRAGWIAAEIEYAKRFLWNIRGVAKNDRRQFCCNRRDVKSAERLSEKSSRKIVEYERYIAALKECLRAAAS
jgi:hypothetical protein